MRRQTATALIEELAARRGQSPALIYGGETVGFDALLERSRRVARGLADAGIGPGDRVALWLPNLPAYMVLFFALARIGAVAVAVNTRYRAMEVQDILSRSRAKALAMWPGFKDIDFAGILAQVDPAGLTALETVICYGEGADAPESVLGRAVLRYADLERAAPMTACLGDGNSPCNIFTTSGTTSAPKFVQHRQAGIVTHAREVATAFGWDRPGAVTVQPLPLCGVFGFCVTMGTLAGGAPVVVLPLFEPVAVAEAIVRNRGTHFMGTDDMYWGILRARGDERPFPHLRICGYASFNPGLDQLLEETTRRGVPLFGLYGMSEVQALFSIQRADAPFSERIEGGGVPVSPSAFVRVRDPETGTLLPAGRSGELEIKAPSVMAGYADNPDATAGAFTDDGFFRTGDAAHMRTDGSFVYEARMGDVLRLAGFLTSPTEIEAFIERHPSVEGVQVVGVTTAKGTRPFAFVTPAAGCTIDEAALAGFCRDGMANYKVPMRFVALDAFPVTPSANGFRIQRARLRAMAQEIADAPAAVGAA